MLLGHASDPPPFRTGPGRRSGVRVPRAAKPPVDDEHDPETVFGRAAAGALDDAPAEPPAPSPVASR